MSPARKRLLMGAIDVGRQLAAAKRRRTVAIIKFGHLRLPDNCQRYPVTYIDALLASVRTIVSADNLRLFNSGPAAREALKQANIDLHIRLDERLAESPEEGFLSAMDLARILSVDPTRTARWHKDNLVASKLADGKTYLHVADLMTKCHWILPKK